MKKSIVSFLSIVGLFLIVVSCSQSIEQQQVQPSVSKMNVEEKMKWIESIVSKYHQSKGSRVASFCPGGVQFLGDLGILGCDYKYLSIPSSINCGVFAFTAGANLADVFSAKPGYANQVNTNIYIIKDDGTLIGYGVDSADNNGNIVPIGTKCNLVYFKVASGDCGYLCGTSPVGAGTSCTDSWQGL